MYITCLLLTPYTHSQQTMLLSNCPGFSWNRVNCHKKPVGHTAWSLTQSNQTNGIFSSMWWHAGWGRVITAREHAGHHAVRKLHCVFLASYFLLISIIVVTVLFFCCSVKLSLSQHTNFAFFLLIFLPIPLAGSSESATRWSFVASQG